MRKVKISPNIINNCSISFLQRVRDSVVRRTQRFTVTQFSSRVKVTNAFQSRLLSCRLCTSSKGWRRRTATLLVQRSWNFSVSATQICLQTLFCGKQWQQLTCGTLTVGYSEIVSFPEQKIRPETLFALWVLRSCNPAPDHTIGLYFDCCLSSFYIFSFKPPSVETLSVTTFNPLEGFPICPTSTTSQHFLVMKWERS